MNDHGKEFSMMLGGPLYQLYLRVGLARPPLDLLARRMIAIPLFAWLPLAILSLAGGAAWGGVPVPFLNDIEVHVRFLVALPLLILAEVVVHQRIRQVIGHFTEAGLVPPDEEPAYCGILASAMRWRNSILAELVIVAIALTVGRLLWLNQFALETATWYAAPMEGAAKLTQAGQWYSWVSVPLFQFILFRWFYRIVIWFGALLRIASLRLRLVPTHPDRSAGLGFLGLAAEAFMPVVLAQGALVAGMIASHIFHGGKSVLDFKVEMIGGLILVMMQVLVPLCVFAPKLAESRREGLYRYGRLSSRFVERFDGKWTGGGGAQPAELPANDDVSGLCDISGGYEAVRGMRAFPFGRKEIVQLAVGAMLPVAPLFLTMMSPAELMKKVMGFLL